MPYILECNWPIYSLLMSYVFMCFIGLKIVNEHKIAILIYVIYLLLRRFACAAISFYMRTPLFLQEISQQSYSIHNVYYKILYAIDSRIDFQDVNMYWNTEIYVLRPWRSERISWYGWSILLIGWKKFPTTHWYSTRGRDCLLKKKDDVSMQQNVCNKIVILWEIWSSCQSMQMSRRQFVLFYVFLYVLLVIKVLSV